MEKKEAFVWHTFFKAVGLAFAVSLLAACGGGSSDPEDDTGGGGGGSLSTFYKDADGDGYGDSAMSQQASAAPTGYVSQAGDCNDNDAAIHPGAQEQAGDGVDNNCNGQVDETLVTYYQDADGDGYGNSAESMTAFTQPNGYVTDATDCDDSQASINPAATEIFDGFDNNCDGATDDVPPRKPELALEYQPIKKLHFTWADVMGETEYRLLENSDATSGYEEVVVLQANASSSTLERFLPFVKAARYMLRACNSYGCTDSDEVLSDVNLLIQAVGHAKASFADAQAWFGNAVALSADGNTLAVGANYENSGASGIDGDQTDTSKYQSGAVYVFAKSASGDWSQQAYIKASNPDAYDDFGWSVALSADGNTLVVGAPGEDGSATGINTPLQNSNGVSASGAAYVFVRSNGSWSQQAYVKASNTHQDYLFGSSVSLSADGNTMVIGSPGEAGSSTGIGGNQDYAAGDGWNSGAVYVFVRGGSEWTQQEYIKASNTDPYDYFGTAVSLSSDGNRLAVGATGEDSQSPGIGGDQADNSIQDSGAVYLFSRSGGAWTQDVYVKASNPGMPGFGAGGDYFGFAVGLSGDGKTLVVSSPREDSAAQGINGIETDDSAGDSGAVYVFAEGQGGWSQQAYIKASNSEYGEEFGMALALSSDGSVLAVGTGIERGAATGIDGDETDKSLFYEGRGAVYLFVRESGSWLQHSYIKSLDEGNYNNRGVVNFGQAVDLDASGRTLAVGAPSEKYGPTGIGGYQESSSANPGAVYLY